MSSQDATYRFGPYELRTRSRELFKQGTRLKVRPQPFLVLQALAKSHGDVVTREELKHLLWPAETFVDFEHGLNTAIKELRSVLNDSADKPRYIETMPRLGYRILVSVTGDTPAPLNPAASHSKGVAAEAVVTGSVSRIRVRRLAGLPQRPILVGASIALIVVLVGYVRWSYFLRHPLALAGGALKARGGPFAYITDVAGGTVSVIDTATNKLTAIVPVQSYPEGVAVTPDGTRVYVANRYSNTISVIDTTTNKVSATVPGMSNPVGVAVSRDGTRVYVGNFLSSTISVIDTASNAVTTTVLVPGGSPSAVAVTPDGTRVYVSNFFSSTVSVIDTATNTMAATVPVQANPGGVAVTPNGTRVYVANEGSNTVSVIDTASDKVTATVPVNRGGIGVVVTPDGARVYVANNGGTVSVIDTATNLVSATVSVGSSPFGIGVTPDGTRVYVTNRFSSTVSVIDTATNKVTATLQMADGAQPASFGKFISNTSPTVPPRR